MIITHGILLKILWCSPSMNSNNYVAWTFLVFEQCYDSVYADKLERQAFQMWIYRWYIVKENGKICSLLIRKKSASGNVNRGWSKCHISVCDKPLVAIILCQHFDELQDIFFLIMQSRQDSRESYIIDVHIGGGGRQRSKFCFIHHILHEGIFN